MEVELVLKILGAGLAIWESKEKTKYQDRFIELEKAYYEEINKDDNSRNDAFISNLRVELRILAESFAAAVKK